LPTTVKLICWREVVDGQGIEVLARGGEGIEDRLPQTLAAPVVINRLGVTRVPHKPLRIVSGVQQDT
jgi:hypothetical protein